MCVLVGVCMLACAKREMCVLDLTKCVRGCVFMSWCVAYERERMCASECMRVSERIR